MDGYPAPGYNPYMAPRPSRSGSAVAFVSRNKWYIGGTLAVGAAAYWIGFATARAVKADETSASSASSSSASQPTIVSAVHEVYPDSVMHVSEQGSPDVSTAVPPPEPQGDASGAKGIATFCRWWLELDESVRIGADKRSGGLRARSGAPRVVAADSDSQESFRAYGRFAGRGVRSDQADGPEVPGDTSAPPRVAKSPEAAAFDEKHMYKPSLADKNGMTDRMCRWYLGL